MHSDRANSSASTGGGSDSSSLVPSGNRKRCGLLFIIEQNLFSRFTLEVWRGRKNRERTVSGEQDWRSSHTSGFRIAASHNPGTQPLSPGCNGRGRLEWHRYAPAGLARSRRGSP